MVFWSHKFCLFCMDFTLKKTFGWLKGPNKTDFVMLLTRTNICYVSGNIMITIGMRERVNMKYGRMIFQRGNLFVCVHKRKFI